VECNSEEKIMSTRTQIGFYEEEGYKIGKGQVALIYKHCDGYPAGVLPQLMPFLHKFFRAWPGNVEYAAARTLQIFMDKQDKDGMGGPKFLGYGICNALHGDIAYFYAVLPTKVDVYKMTYGSDTPTLLGSLPIGKGNDKKYVARMVKKFEGDNE
jgi:hypothetical protein